MNTRATRRRARDRTLPAVALAIVAVVSCTFLSSANAGFNDVEVSPSTGPVGTTVTVTGWDCLPSLLINPSHAGVLVVTLGVSIDVVVPPNGAWSVQFVVPAGALTGPHAIVATCTRDLIPLPYAPLTFTVTAPEPPAPTTTIDDGVAATTTTTTTTLAATTTTSTVPPTTAGAEPTTTIASGGGSSGDDPPADGQIPTTAAVGTAAPPSIDRTTTPATTTAVTTTQAVAGAAHAVAVARVQRNERRPLVFGTLTPIGRGWMGLLISALIVAAFLSALLAILWFRWLRHTRARDWWIRWSNQILRIKAHARPPA